MKEILKNNPSVHQIASSSSKLRISECCFFPDCTSTCLELVLVYKINENYNARNHIKVVLSYWLFAIHEILWEEFECHVRNQRFVMKTTGKQIKNHSMSTCKLKYAYNKFERTQSGAGYKTIWYRAFFNKRYFGCCISQRVYLNRCGRPG